MPHLSNYIKKFCEGDNCAAHNIRNFLVNGERTGWKKTPKGWDDPKVKKANPGTSMEMNYPKIKRPRRKSTTSKSSTKSAAKKPAKKKK